MKSKYIIRSRISEKAFREILKLFCIDIEASKIAKITGVSRPAINRIVDKIRDRIAHDCERISPFEPGSVELDESYFGPQRVQENAGFRHVAAWRSKISIRIQNLPKSLDYARERTN
ncbi:hypothetical protein [Candidatus Spongiihabitans sp.]|uniref:hypothetical protein n=1 Tax=Candidatus Spongiihabitans sp. TaxID=3101308 RepID=UPI003C7B5752